MTIALPPGITVFERGWLSANNILFTGQRDTALVDTGYCSHADQTVELVRASLGSRALDRVLNTHLHSDHCGGNATLQALKESEAAAQKSRVEKAWARTPTSMARAMAEIRAGTPQNAIVADETITANLDLFKTFTFKGPGDYYSGRGGGIGDRRLIRFNLGGLALEFCLVRGCRAFRCHVSPGLLTAACSATAAIASSRSSGTAAAM